MTGEQAQGNSGYVCTCGCWVPYNVPNTHTCFPSPTWGTDGERMINDLERLISILERVVDVLEWKKLEKE